MHGYISLPKLVEQLKKRTNVSAKSTPNYIAIRMPLFFNGDAWAKNYMSSLLHKLCDFTTDFRGWFMVSERRAFVSILVHAKNFALITNFFHEESKAYLMGRAMERFLGEDRVVIDTDRSPPSTSQRVKLPLCKSLSSAMVDCHTETDITGWLKQCLHMVGRCKLRFIRASKIDEKAGKAWLIAKRYDFLAWIHSCNLIEDKWCMTSSIFGSDVEKGAHSIRARVLNFLPSTYSSQHTGDRANAQMKEVM